MNEKIKKYISCIVIFCILAISLTGCSKEDGTKTSKEKVNTEIAYLDTKLIAMLNKANGISLENYIVKAEQINEQSSNGGTSNQSSSSSKSGGGSDSSGEQGGENNNTGSGSQNSNNSNSNKNSVQYKMEGNEILLQDRKTDWDGLKADIEKLYSDWSEIELDLYKVNANNQDILSFSTDLDAATQAIKNEDKVKTLSNLAKLYAYIPKYSKASSNDTRTNNLYSTKASVLNAYALIEQDDFAKVEQEMKNAEQSFLPIINDMNSNTNNQTNINKAYILIKELQNFNNNKDKEVFYIKYKNLIQELNII